MICSINIYPLLLLDQSHIFLGLDHGLIVFKALCQLLLSQIVLVVRYEEVGQEEPGTLEMLGKLQLIIVLQTGLQIVTPIRLLFLDELTQSHADQARDIVLMFS